MKAIVKLSKLGLPPLQKRRCNCCRLSDDDTCMSPRITTRERGIIPGCTPAGQSKTFCEEENVNAKVTDYAEYMHTQTELYKLGELKYDEWWRRTWNYGKLTPVR